MKNLKTVFVVVTALLLLNSNSFAQKGQSSSGNCVEKGTILIDGFYGFPYINGTLLKAAYRDSLGRNNQVRNLNHFGGKVEVMLTDKMGVGIEGTWASATVRYIGNNGLIYTAGVDKIRVLAKMSFHFATGENVDPYLTWGLGYKKTNVYTNEPGEINDISLNIVPIAFRVGIGMRYFFTDMIGVNAEVGLGGPMMQGGLSLKF